MKILFIGDISGPDGLRAVQKELKNIKIKYNIDFTIANAENASEGRGLKFKDYIFLNENGIDFFTMGNHTWFHSDYSQVLENHNIIRPGNLKDNQVVYNIGTYTRKIKIKNKILKITNLIGNTLEFRYKQTNAFLMMDKILEEDQDYDIHIVDFHSETTSEKNAFFNAYKGKVDAILGTHTHVQTADERIRNNTAFITDVGMTGNSEGVIGAEEKTIIEMFRGEKQFFKLKTKKGNYQFCAIILTFHENKVIDIERIFIFENNV